MALSVPASVAGQVDDGAVENGTGAGRLDRRTKVIERAVPRLASVCKPERWLCGSWLGLCLSDATSCLFCFADVHPHGGCATAVDGAELGLFDAFFASLSMIVVSEIGDETFIIAALMAMRHPKSTVLSSALSALVVMTVLSTGLGRIVPNLISRKHTNSAATVLYAFFGLRLLYIAWRSRSDSKASQKKEIEEVEEKLEAGQGKSTFRRIFSRFCTPIFLESFVLTFLADWGDRSQIATIALATHKNAIGVATGATLGHTICTSFAVVGGSMLASKISQGTVATIGGLRFLGFSLSSYFYPPL
ncbi:hypothetical protein QOZ80_8AG0638150 [Eleusine coracana subsp. coracana]|nr:hypothetical protein QOZ80_8AG0638150 [Eleusine coracana subsp. coracana]